jgi:hypothetical protein
MKLSEKQKEVIGEMVNGKLLYWSDGLNASCGFSGGSKVKISTATFFKLKDLKIIEKTSERFSMSYYSLTELGKTIQL